MIYLKQKGRWQTGGYRGEKKYTITEKVNGKEKYIMTVPPARELLIILKQFSEDCKENQNMPKSNQITSETFAQQKLSERSKGNKLKKLTQEEIDKLFEISK